MRVDVRTKDLEKLQAIFHRFPSVQSVRIFGSRARGGARRASDIDLAISAPNMTDREWSDMREVLNTASLIYHLDVIRLDTILDEQLRVRIDADGVSIYPISTKKPNIV